ncbi:MAG: DUF4198 domain-containing protein [Pseudomonadota bacterium]
MQNKMVCSVFKKLAMLCLLLTPVSVYAHFGAIIPSDDMVGLSEEKQLAIKVMFIHPMEMEYMNMAQPVQFGVLTDGKKQDLLKGLKESKVGDGSIWQTIYNVKRPGDIIFYMEPQAYWEPAEDCFITHYTKVIVNALGMEKGWDDEVGMKAEIIPLTRPYGLWAGNIFQGVVKVDGKPMPYVEVEVEYYNEERKISCPADPLITQVVKADQNGVFSYVMPKAGWWGFAALTQSKDTISYDGNQKPVEIGAVLWVKTHDMK